MEFMAETKIVADVEHIRDIRKIAKEGVFMTPVVVVDGEVKCVGKVPKKEEVIKWITK